MLLNEGIKSNWIHIFIEDKYIENASKAAKAIKNFNLKTSCQQTHISLVSFLSWRVVFQTLKDFMIVSLKGALLQSRLKKHSELATYWALFENDWKNSVYGTVAIKNLLFLNLFEKALGCLKTQELGVYLQENQGWESGLLNAWNRSGHKSIVGFPHTTLRFWDLVYFSDPRQHLQKTRFSRPSPNYVACSGNAMYRFFRENGVPSTKLIRVEALRYLHLERTLKTSSRNKKYNNKIVILGDYLKADTEKLLSIIENTVNFFNLNKSFLFKPHPACLVDIKKYKRLKIRKVMQPIPSILKCCNLAISSSKTSAAIDAFYHNIPVASFLDGSSLNFSPLRNRKNVCFFSNKEELNRILFNLKEKNIYAKDTKDYFYLDNRLSKWKKLLLSKAEKF